MKSYNLNIKKAKKKMMQIVKGIKGHARIPSIEDIFKNQNGKTLAYIKEIKEIDNLAIVRLKGFIDSYTIPIIRANLGSKIERYFDKHILLDFKEVTRIDSATLASLVQLLNELKTHDKKMGIVNATSFLRSYLSIAKLESMVRIYKDEKTALKEFRG